MRRRLETARWWGEAIGLAVLYVFVIGPRDLWTLEGTILRMSKYIAPSADLDAFNCPHCGVFAHFTSYNLFSDRSEPSPGGLEPLPARVRFCSHCQRPTFWYGAFLDEMIYPHGVGNAPLPNQDMPEDVQKDYLEARTICNDSPRGAAALLRLAVQKLCVHLGQPGKKINDDIKKLVADGLPVTIQKALDVVRVTGNNAVHPGEMPLEESPEMVQVLFKMLNAIVQDRITQPREIQAAYDTLPETAREGIEKRDAG